MVASPFPRALLLAEPSVIGRIAAFATLCDLGRRH
jgi:hypothetical protein